MACNVLVLDGMAEFAGFGPELGPLPERKPINEKACESHPKPTHSNTSAAKKAFFANEESTAENSDAPKRSATKKSALRKSVAKKRLESASSRSPDATAAPDAEPLVGERRYRLSLMRTALELATTRTQWSNNANTLETFENDFRCARASTSLQFF